MQVKVSDPEEEIKVLKTQDFERQFNAQRHTYKDQGFALPDDLKIDDLVEFNEPLEEQLFGVEALVGAGAHGRVGIAALLALFGLVRGE